MKSPLPVRSATSLKALIGSGDRIGLFTLPVLVGAVILYIAYPSTFDVGGPPATLRAISVAVMLTGIVIWAWSVTLIVTRVPRGELITSGPYALMKHPIYTSVALLVLPWAGFLCDTWLGVVVGITLYTGSRIFAPAEETQLSQEFGSTWQEYVNAVKIPWL
jgi:protein-S-isoprenylcysteine O-methyltransferase Ste14